MARTTTAAHGPAHRQGTPLVARARAAVVALGLLALGGTAASALWSDAAAVESTIVSGTLGINVDGQEANPTPYIINMSLLNMAPGGTRSKEVTVNNTGTLPVLLSMATANTGGAQGLATALTGSAAVPDHAGAPAGPLLSRTFADKAIPPGGSTKVTLTVSVPFEITNDWQGKSDTIRFLFTAVQAPR